MKIKDVLTKGIFCFLFFLPVNSFSQGKPPFDRKSIEPIYDSLKVDDGYVFLMLAGTCSFIDRKGNVLLNIPGNLASFNFNKQEIAAHVDRNLVVYNKDMEELWKIPGYFEHELTITNENKMLFFSNESHTINNTNVNFNNIICVDSTRKKSVLWSSFKQRRYIIDFMMKDTSLFRYKINGSSDPDSVLFKMAPTLKKIPAPTLMTSKISSDTLSLSPQFADGSSQNRELFHMNTIQIIPENESEKKNSVFRKGNILLSFNNLNDSIRSFIAVVDPESFKILWYYVQKDGRYIHTPTMLLNGHILVFVNMSSEVDYSSIDEIDPVTKEIVWRYTENFPHLEVCKGMGSCQRLPNGNTFISNVLGYAYEVTPEKEIVWLWRTTPTIKKGDRLIYRAYWYPKEKFKWLEIEK